MAAADCLRLASGDGTVFLVDRDFARRSYQVFREMPMGDQRKEPGIIPMPDFSKQLLSFPNFDENTLAVVVDYMYWKCTTNRKEPFDNQIPDDLALPVLALSEYLDI